MHPQRVHAQQKVLVNRALTVESDMRGAMTAGSKRVYSWLPNTAAETSKPLPTLPCARQCIYCERLCASFRPSLDDSVPPSVANESAGMTLRCNRSPETRDVISAADDPMPVLCTSGSRTPVLLNGGSFSSDSRVGGRFCAESCGEQLNTRVSEKSGGYTG